MGTNIQYTFPIEPIIEGGLRNEMKEDVLIPSTALLAIALISAVWGVVSSMVIVSRLRDRGIKTSFFLLRLLIIKYVAQYRAITREETGRTGPWFYSFIVAMNLALVCVIVGLLLR